MSSAPVVLFDGNCWLCSSLAQFAERQALGKINFTSWQQYSREHDISDTEPCCDKLRIVVGAETLVDVAAWEWLLEHHPSLKPLDWLAARIGISQTAATLLQRTGRAMRRFCRACR